MKKQTDIGGARRLNISTEEPAPTVMAGGIESMNTSQYQVVSGSRKKKDRPPYVIPTMEEINAIPWNGFNVISTFSGCGGSSLGYRMAGFRVLWANEFIPAAQETYRANMSPSCILDCRDIRTVTPEEILSEIKMGKGELDLLDGSPPCQAFSIAGKRANGWNKPKKYSNNVSQCNETLFFDYIRILTGLQPKVFVAENVSGLVKGVAKGYFLEILAALREAGYKVSAKLLDAQWLGVPQMRQRIIFVGVRNDLSADPVHPSPYKFRYSVRDAIPWLTQAVHDTGGTNPNRWAANVDFTNKPCPTITCGPEGMNAHHYKMTGEPDPEPLPDISRFAIGKEWDKLKPGEQSKKYFNLIRTDPNKPCPTVLSSHGNIGMAGITHPTEKRKFTIQELKRICSFPDDFILTGTYRQQWERLGNCVPPLMMKAIAIEIRERILCQL